MPQNNGSRFRLAAYGLFLGVTAVCAEVGAYSICRFVVQRAQPDLLYAPPVIDRAQWERQLRIRDPLLGWPTTDALNSPRHDASGARPSPQFPESDGACVSLYGDSFVYGDEVSDSQAWGNLLAKSLDCRVANFGVSGFGTDQAVLRFESNSDDHAVLSILGILPHNVMRNVNQYFYLLGAPDPLSFKPRFVIAGDRLERIPAPKPSFDDWDNAANDLSRILDHETFLPGSGVGPEPFRFPFSLALAKLLFYHERVRSWLSGNPSWASFLNEAHPSQALQITSRLARRFADRCDDDQRRCFVLLFPTPSSYHSYASTGTLVVQPVLDQLEQANVRSLALSPAIRKRLGERSYCEIVVDSENCTGHLNPEGNQVVADIVESFISEASLLPDRTSR